MIFDLKVTYDLEGKGQSPPKHNRDLNEDVLHIIYQGDPSLSEGLCHRENNNTHEIKNRVNIWNGNTTYPSQLKIIWELKIRINETEILML